MTKAIWKYELHPGVTAIMVPKGERVLCFSQQEQFEDTKLCVWILVDPTAEKVERRFILSGTSHQVEDRQLGRYVGTVFLHRDQLVIHCFEEAS